MAFELLWLPDARRTFDELTASAIRVLKGEQPKATKAQGLYKQVVKCVEFLASNPRHPGLHTHEFQSLENPYDKKQKVFEAYAQNRTPGAYRVFWCYGPGKNQLTIIAITPHP
jgi:hypothetical protein